MSSLLFAIRRPFTVVASIYIFVTVIAMWTLAPQFDFQHQWQDDLLMKVREVPVSSPAYNFLQPDDLILEIDGQPVSIKNATAKPFQASHLLTIERAGETLKQVVPSHTHLTLSTFAYLSPATLLTLIYLIVGFLILQRANSANEQAIHLGYIFIINAIVVLGLQAQLSGIPFAWMTGVPLLLLLACNTLYTAFLPRQSELPNIFKKGFILLYFIAGMFFVLGVVENAWFIPDGTTFALEYGVSLYQAGTGIVGISLLLYLIILTARTISLPKSPLRQQHRTLLLFLSLAILPSVTLTILPRALFDVIILPFPIAIVLLALIPLAYFFVINRRGSFILDKIFGRGALYISVSLLVIICYSALLIVLKSWYLLDSVVIQTVALAAIPVWILGTISQSLLQGPIERIMFGDIAEVEKRLPIIATSLAAQPEIEALEQILQEVAADFDISQAVFACLDENGRVDAIAAIDVEWEAIKDIQPIVRTIVRSTSSKAALHPLMREHAWIEMLVPVTVRGEEIGLLALSRPKNQHFNTKHADFMQRVADILAIGSQAILLFESSRQLSLELINVQETERLGMRSAIHDNTIQEIGSICGVLSMVSMQVEDETLKQELRVQTERLSATVDQLRDICTQLYPSTIDHGLKVLASELVDRFAEEHDLNIKLKLDVPRTRAVGSRRISRVIYRIMLESLQNVVKHAKTRDVQVAIEQTESAIKLEVVDDGVGGITKRLSKSQLLRSRHIGVIGMSDWATSVGGNLQITENSPHGTRLQLEIPI